MGIKQSLGRTCFVRRMKLELWIENCVELGSASGLELGLVRV
jgi:hypothetical protein